MHVQLARLHAQGGGVVAPATADEIDGLARVLGVPLPSVIREIYQDHGCEERDFGELRLMSPSESADAIIALRGFGVPFDDHELIDHEEPSPEPYWRSVESLYDALLDARGSGLDWWELATDYPREPTDSAPADDALASRLFALHHEQPDTSVGRRAVFRALALSSATHEAQIVSLLRSEDMWVQERAVQILGHWRWEPAVTSIVDVVRNGQHNGRTAGIHALKRIGTPEARAALRSVGQDDATGPHA